MTVFLLDWGTNIGATYSGFRGSCWRWGNRLNKTIDDVFMSVHNKVVLETISRCFGWMRGMGLGRTLGVARGGWAGWTNPSAVVFSGLGGMGSWRILALAVA